MKESLNKRFTQIINYKTVYRTTMATPCLLIMQLKNQYADAFHSGAFFVQIGFSSPYEIRMENFCGFIPCLHTKHPHLFVSHCTLQTAHYKLHTANCSPKLLYNILYTLKIAQCTLHTALSTVYSAQ